jgi:hypothetical protein
MKRSPRLLAPNIQMPLHHPLARRSTMRASIDPVATRLGERRNIASIGCHASAAIRIHQASEREDLDAPGDPHVTPTLA